MIDSRCLTGVCALLGCWPAVAAITVSTDHADALYACGEQAVFTARIISDSGALLTTGVVRSVMDNFGAGWQREASFDLSKGNPFVVTGRLDEPGFLRLTLKGAGCDGANVWSVGYEPDRISPVTTVPNDFDAFWSAARKRLSETVPLDPQIERIPERSTGECDFYRLSFATLGRRIYGYMTVPKGERGRKYPVTITVPGASFDDSANDLKPTRGRVNVMLSVCPFAPHWDWRRLGLKMKLDAWNHACLERFGTTYAAAGANVSREDYVFYPVILGMDRAIDWIAAREEVDETHIAYQGTSQGAGLGLALTGLNKHITRAVFYVPALTDTLASLSGRQSGWPRPLEFQRTDESRRCVRNVMPYFDGVSFASRITCPVRIVVGFSDTICAPHCVWAMYNAVSSKDKMLFYGIGMGHGCRAEFYAALGQWLRGPSIDGPMAVTLTFDDNQKELATYVRPALDRHGWKGIFNVITGWPSLGCKDRLTWDDVRDLDKCGHEIGNHSLTHLNLSHLLAHGETNVVRQEILESKKVYAFEMGKPPVWFCYPGNSSNSYVRKLVLDSGMESLECHRLGFGSPTPPRTDKGAYIQLLEAVGRRQKCVDTLVHGISRGHGWQAFDNYAQFEGYLSEIQELEDEGFIRVLPYSVAHRFHRNDSDGKNADKKMKGVEKK